MRNNYNRKTPFRGEELRRPEMTGNFGKAFVKLQEAAENGGMLLKINFQAAIIIVILPGGLKFCWRIPRIKTEAEPVDELCFTFSNTAVKR